MRRNYKIFGIARSLYKIGSACVNFVVGQALEPMSQPASNELDTENTQAYKNGIFGITSSGNMPQSVQEDVVSHLDCKYEDLIKNAGIFVPKTTFEDRETGYDKNAVVYTQNNDNTITLYVSQVDNNKSIDLSDTNYWVQEATIPGLIDGSKLTLDNLSDTAKNNIKDIVNLDSSDFSLLKTSLDDIIPTNNKELNGDTITSATIVVPERINYLKTKLTPAPNFTIVDGEPSVDLSGCYLISMAQRNLITSTYNGDCKYYTYIEGSDTLILPTVQDMLNQLTKNLVCLEKISEFEIDNVAEIEFTGLNDGYQHKFEFINITSTINAYMVGVLGNSNGYINSGYTYCLFGRWSEVPTAPYQWITDSYAFENSALFVITSNHNNFWYLNNQGSYVDFTTKSNLSVDGNQFFEFNSMVNSPQQSGKLMITNGNGMLLGATGLDRVKFYLSSGNFASGVIKHYIMK